MTAIDEYVRQVMEHVPAASPERSRIQLDVRVHLQEAAAAEESMQEAINRMGDPREVALAYLADAPVRFAPLGRRTAAFLIDVGLGLVVLVAIAALVGLCALTLGVAGSVELPQSIGVLFLAPIAIAILLLSVAYFPVLEWRYGQTLGKWLLGIHVVKENGLRLGLMEAIVRRIPFFLEFFWIDAIVAFLTDRKQRAFDLVAGTIVVSCEVPSAQQAPVVEAEATQ